MKHGYKLANSGIIRVLLIGMICIGIVFVPAYGDKLLITGKNSSVIQNEVLTKMVHGMEGLNYPPFERDFINQEPYDLPNTSKNTDRTGVADMTVAEGNVSDIQLTWQKCLGGSLRDRGNAVISTTDGGFLVGGSSSSNDGDVSGNHGSNDYWIVKLDSSGALQWQKCFGGSGSDVAYSVIQTSDGGFLAGGTSSSNDGDVSGNHGNYDLWVVKLDSSGALQWQKCLGGSSEDWAQSVIQTTDGGYLIGGNTWSDDGNVTGNHGLSDYWIVKLTPSGALQWQRCLGGLNSDAAYSVIQTSDGGYLAGGSTYSNDGNVSGNHGQSDYWVVKLDGDGNLLWQKCMGGSDNDIAQSVIQTTDGGYLVGGMSSSNDGNVSGNHGSNDFWIVKLDDEGNLLWQKCLGGSSGDWAYSVIQTSDGGYLVGGSTFSNNGDVSGYHRNGDYWVVKLDDEGNLIWQKCLGGSQYDNLGSVIQTSDGRYLAGGYTNSNDGDITGYHGGSDYWLARITVRHPVTATANPWTIIYPAGNQSYNEGTNATYVTQAKPGATLVNVMVDEEARGNLSHWTFTTITENHTISTSGIPTPGQVHAFFLLNTSWGTVPLTVAFTNQSLGDPTSFSWNFGDGTSSTDQDPIHTYTTPGTYLVTLRAMNDQTGGIATLNNAVTVTAGVTPSPTPTPVPGGIKVEFSADQTFGPAPLQVSFVDQSTGNPISWLWDLGDGNLSTSQNVTHIYAAKGTYSVTLSAQNSLSTGSLQKNGYITAT